MATQQNLFQVPNVKFRVLIIGKANAGKTSILQRVCDTTESPKIYRVDQSGQRSEVQLEPTTERGLHRIDDEIIFERHDGYIFHDSRGFEAGGENELKIVQEFIGRKSREKRLKDRLHAIWFCIPMDNDRPSLDTKHFDGICPDKNVPVIALFTKYDQFKRNIKIKFMDRPETHIDAEVKRGFEEHYLAGLSGPPPYICLERMHRAGQECTDLIKLTANSLSGDVVALMLVAVQKDNLELSINCAIKSSKFVAGKIKSIDIVLKRCLEAFPWLWYLVDFQFEDSRIHRFRERRLEHRLPLVQAEGERADDPGQKFEDIRYKLQSMVSDWYFSFWNWNQNQNTHHMMIVTIIILEFTCRFCASSPDSTRAKVLDDAYYQYIQSSTHDEVKRQFPGSPKQYSISQYTEFILQHRL